MSRTYKDADRRISDRTPSPVRARQNRALRRILNATARQWDEDKPVPLVREVRWVPRCGCCW